MSAEFLKPGQYAEWDAFVNAHPLSTVFHLSAWNRIAKKVYGIENTIAVSRGPSGQIRGGTTLFFAKRPGSWYVTSGIFGAYGPILGDREALREVLDAAKDYARGRKAKYLHLKALEGPKGKNDFTHPSYDRQDIWVTAFMAVGGTAEELWKSLPGPMRTKVRKAEKSELGIRWASASGAGGAGIDERELKEFYDVLADNMHRKGSPIYGYAFMQEIMREFADGKAEVEADTLILELKSGEAGADGSGKAEVVSGAMVLRHKGVVYVPFVSSRSKFFPLRPNNLLYWEIIRDANRRGNAWLDFGTSIRGASTLQFKESWGAATYPVVSYVYSESGEKIRLDAGAKSVQFGVELWKKLPRGVADRLGPVLSKLMV
ncbi:MAG: GNAT family N-acetyltransferase [Bdellovibrionales bacterium]|nr:GNAT family N-acetyltransferase [Bdellovibrionales bacterium]